MTLTGHTCQELLCKALNVGQGKREVIVVFEEVEYGAREKPRNDADVISVVEAVNEVNAFAVGSLERVGNGSAGQKPTNSSRKD